MDIWNILSIACVGKEQLNEMLLNINIINLFILKVFWLAYAMPKLNRPRRCGYFGGEYLLICWKCPISANICSRNNTNNNVTYDISQALDILRNPNFNPALPTAIYIHGWTETPEALSVQTVVGAYLQTHKWNILILDSKLLDTTIYEFALNHVQRVRWKIRI